ncbi:hypothetical protein ACF044_02760 [Microbacterium sp. NPDC016588]
MKDEQLDGAQPKPRSPAELDSLVDIFLARLAELDERFLAAYTPGTEYVDFPGRLEVADDIDAIGTNDKELGRAIRDELSRRYPYPTDFMQECVDSLDVFLEADEELAIAESLDDSRAAVTAWTQTNGHHVGTRGRLPHAVRDAYRLAMVQEMRSEALAAFNALNAVRGSRR